MKKVSGERKRPNGGLIFNNGVELWGGEDPKTYELISTYRCKNCGKEKELREEIPNLSRRAGFKAEAKAHNCKNNNRSRQFIEEAISQERTRKDIHG